MRRLKNISILLVTLIAAMTISPIEAKKNKVSPEQKGLFAINHYVAKAHTEFLASDALKGRECGTEYGYIAGEYLISSFKQMGVTPLFENSFVQPFEAYALYRKNAGYTVHPEGIKEIKQGPHRKTTMRNILAKIEGKNPDEIVIIGAHYDHLGYDANLVNDQIYNGADDNASGVQAVLQILQAFLATGQQPERTVIFALWDGEEQHLLGSTYFVNNFADIKKVKGYMNLDMIGGSNSIEDAEQHFNLNYMAADSIYADWLKSDIEQYSLNLTPNFKPSEKGCGSSDQVSFFNAGTSVVWYNTDTHSDYHMPTDECDRINYNKMVEITKAAFLCLWKMANNSL